MGTLKYDKEKFYFRPSNVSDDVKAKKAGFQLCEDVFRWTTRSAVKAKNLRRFANESAKLKLKNTFFTDFEAPEYIVYPDHLKPTLFQIESAWHALTRSPAYVADEAGLGKTIVAALCMNTVPGKSLIVCPPFLKYNWVNEVEKWCSPALNQKFFCEDLLEGILFCHFLNDSRDFWILPDSQLSKANVLRAMTDCNFEWIFIDEAHRFKEASAKRTQALLGDASNERYGITSFAERVVYLSGTPLPNGRPIELFPILERTAPETIKHRTFEEYGKEFCAGKKVTRFEGKRAVANWDFSGASNLKQLKKELSEKLMIRHLKKDVLSELPPKTRNLIYLDAPTHLLPMEEKILNNFCLEDLIGDDVQLGEIATYRKELGIAKITQAFNYIYYLLESSRDKLVVGAYHIEVVDGLGRMLSEFNPLIIRGGLTAREKSERVKTFQSDSKHRLVIGNVDAMGVGNTLTAAPGMVIVEPSWSPTVNEQLEDRIHRITQNKNTYFRYLVMRNSLDERMLKQVLRKQKAINQVMS